MVKRIVVAGVAMVAAMAAMAGFFSVEQTPEGRWWVKDAEGKRTIIRGVDWVCYRGHCCEADGLRCHYREWNDAHYSSPAAWEKETLARLKDWGFNMLGAGSDATLRHRGFAHAWDINFGNRFGKVGDGNDERWIMPQEGCPCSALPNVFHPDFAAYCERMAAKVCTPLKYDRDLLGYFLDNELRWWGAGAWGGYAGVYVAVTNKPATHSARKALAAFEREHPEWKGEALQRGFLEYVAETYFRVTTAAVRKADPNHLILGCRFAGIGGADRVVWEAAGRYSDILTFNLYPEADIDRMVMRWPDGRLMTDEIIKVYGWAKRPVLITEWSFPALDSGLPCTNGMGQRLLTQQERAAATELCAKTFLSLPCLVGYDYFMWVDEPFNGISKTFPENTNYGLVSEQGVPYPEITSMFRRLHAEIEKWRHAPPPEARKPDPKSVAWKPQKPWRGFGLRGCSAAGFREEQFRWLSEWGFNFARLSTEYQNLVSANDGSGFREEGLAALDRAVAWGRKYGIHVQIDLSCEPAQGAFGAIWAVMAKRYRGIPNEELSFNLVSGAQDLTKERQVLKFAEALLAIRAEDPNRFVMMEGSGVVSAPLDILFSLRSTGQSFRWNLEPPEVLPETFDWAAGRGYPVMIGEFGGDSQLEYDTRLRSMERWLKFCKERDFSWILGDLGGPVGILDSGRSDVDDEDFHGHRLDRKMLNLLLRYR